MAANDINNMEAVALHQVVWGIGIVRLQAQRENGANVAIHASLRYVMQFKVREDDSSITTIPVAVSIATGNFCR
jgi:hypothetical protein